MEGVVKGESMPLYLLPARPVLVDKAGRVDKHRREMAESAATLVVEVV